MGKEKHYFLRYSKNDTSQFTIITDTEDTHPAKLIRLEIDRIEKWYKDIYKKMSLANEIISIKVEHFYRIL